jgi:hypothetical protein
MRKPWTEEEKDIVRTMAAQGCGDKEIAEVLEDRSRAAISKFRITHNIKIVYSKPKINRKLYEDLCSLKEPQ